MAKYGVKITTKAFNAIVGFEVSSDAWYTKKLQNPTWPELASGITIGIGFDLGYCTVQQFTDAWGPYLSPADFAALKKVIGLRGVSAQNSLASVKHIIVPLASAKKVFDDYSLEDTAKEMVIFAPTVVNLFPDAQGALLSLIYNRGRKTTDDPGHDRRKEMRAIQAMIPNKDYVGIAAQFKSMKRLWPAGSGLLTRRDTEAALVANSDRQYSADELIDL